MNAQELETAFLAGLEDAQGAYEQIVETQAWTDLGFDTFAGWWDERVRPTMRALSMRPTREIAAAVVEQVREEEAELPPAQRRTQRELAEMVGVERSALASRDGSRSVQREESRPADLAPQSSPLVEAMTAAVQEVADAIDRHLPADPDEPHREWRRAFLSALGVGRRAMQFDIDAVADRADDECLDELRRLSADITSYTTRVVARRPALDNVRHLRAI